MRRWCVFAVKGLTILMAILLMTGVADAAGRKAHIPLEQIKLPAGFRIAIYASDVPNARSMVLSPSGTLFVGTRKAGKVYAVLDRNGDFLADAVVTLAKGLNMPNGVAFKNGSLYVAEVSRVLRYDNIEQQLQAPPKPAVVRNDFPTDKHHGWKYIAIGPDGLLYVPVGAPCNVCEQKDPRYASIMRMQLDGSGLEVFTRGVRNTVGFDWHPLNQELWFTNNGRDWMGDELPPDTLHHAPQKDLHFGFPYCHAGEIPDPQYGNRRNCDAFSPPALKLGPHVAPLGMKFYKGSMFPSMYRHQIFMAEHGSWNRSIPIGYRITLALFDNDRRPRYEIFAEGWLQGNRAWGRPVDIVEMADGSLLVSDDKAGAIYRISYSK
ncbi:MAG: PQQ-dependent sugar dehydrogenase [Desulfobacterales bacterium]|jgi:glucose/arabinose dehydrogenase